jgi:hypothetical protein
VGANTKSQPQARTGKDATASGGRPARDPGSVVDAPKQGAAPEPTAGPANPPEPQGPCVRVCGQRVEEFRALIDGQAGALVTKERAIVFNRVYFVDGQFNLGDGAGLKVGGETITGVDYDPNLGLALHTTNYEAFVPAGTIKASWKRPA